MLLQQKIKDIYLYKPYTYYIYCKPLKKHYYGVRYAKNCNPDELWKKYFTSSKIIHQLIEIYGKNEFYFEVRKTFDDPKKALLWEQNVLRRMKINIRNDWLNRKLTGSGVNFYSIGEEAWNKGVPNIRAKGTKFYNNGNIQKMFFPGNEPKGWNLGRLNASRGQNPFFGKTHKKESLDMMKQKLKGRVVWNKGKTYIELIGKERSDFLKQNLHDLYQGKTYEELHGVKNALLIKEKQSRSKLNKNKGK